MPDHVPEVLRPNESIEPTVTADKNESKSASPTANLLRGVSDSANAFSPLRSIAVTLYFILENCMVCPASVSPICDAHSNYSKQRWIYKP